MYLVSYSTQSSFSLLTVNMTPTDSMVSRESFANDNIMSELPTSELSILL